MTKTTTEVLHELFFSRSELKWRAWRRWTPPTRTRAHRDARRVTSRRSSRGPIGRSRRSPTPRSTAERDPSKSLQFLFFVALSSYTRWVRSISLSFSNVHCLISAVLSINLGNIQIKFLEHRESNPWQLGEKSERCLSAMLPPSKFCLTKFGFRW